MGQLMLRNKSGMSTVKKIGIGLVVCYVGLKMLPVVLGMGFFVGLVGAAFVASVIGSLLSLALYIGTTAIATWNHTYPPPRFRSLPPSRPRTIRQ